MDPTGTVSQPAKGRRSFQRCLPFPPAALRHAALTPSCLLPVSALQYAGESDLQLERINVYFNEATGGAPARLPACAAGSGGSG